MSASLLHRMFAAFAIAIIAVAVVWGFVIVGSPGSERLKKFDERRLADLQQIREAIQSVCVVREADKPKLKHPLPRSLEELVELVRAEPGFGPAQVNVDDPQTGRRYEYTVVDQTRFELCAAFALPRDEKSELFWNHAAGRSCFTCDAFAKR